MLTKVALIWSKNSKSSNIVKYYYNLKYLLSIVIYFKMFFSYDGKAEIFSSH